MLIQMTFMLALASFLVEMMFAAKVPYWRKNAHRFKWLNMTISLLLSFILGIAFGAVGLITMGAAMLSTIMSIPGYAFLHWNYDTPEAHAQGNDRVKYYWNNFHVHWAKWRKVLGEFNQLIYAIFRVITFPVRVINKCYQVIKPLILKLNAYSEAKRSTTTRV